MQLQFARRNNHKHGNIRPRLLSSCRAHSLSDSAAAHKLISPRTLAPPGYPSFLRQNCDQNMGQVKSKLSRRARDTQQILPIVPNDVRFRVLIIGRANAGKTSILQRVCDTTDSPEIYRLGPEGERVQVRSHSQWRLRFDDSIIWSGSTRRITRGWKRLFLLVTADHEVSPCSVACIMSRTKSSLRIMGDMFSTTPVDSRQVVKKS